MQIHLHQAGKKYNTNWIFRNCTYTFESGKHYAITGTNGSGKSTILQVLSGSCGLSAGACTWHLQNNEEVDEALIYKHIAIVAPYLELIEEMTAKELLQFHFKFKPCLPNTSIATILAIIGLEDSANKQIRYYSSGMKQRIKLAQAIFCNVPLLLLDEPCTNLDATGYDLYHQLIDNYCKQKLIIVSSNDQQEYNFCENKISILDYKDSINKK